MDFQAALNDWGSLKSVLAHGFLFSGCLRHSFRLRQPETFAKPPTTA